MKKTAIAYIDGYNLHYGLKKTDLRRYAWLNLRALVERLLPNCNVGEVKFCTARIPGPAGGESPQRAAQIHARRARQSAYLSALETIPGVIRYEGHFRSDPMECFYCHNALACEHCKKLQKKDEEKMTDVNLATEMMTDAFDGKFDIALLVSGDSDLVPPIRRIRSRFPDKQVIVAFPPRRKSAALGAVASGLRTIRAAALESCQMPDEVSLKDGRKLRKPAEWV